MFCCLNAGPNAHCILLTNALHVLVGVVVVNVVLVLVADVVVDVVVVVPEVVDVVMKMQCCDPSLRVFRGPVVDQSSQ